MFSFLTQKSKSFIALIARTIAEKFIDNTSEFILIEGPIKGKLYFKQPKDKTVIFTITKEELKAKLDKNIFDKLPENMYYV